MPRTKPTPTEIPSDDEILAAIGRAECHKRRVDAGETLPVIKEHLALPHNSWTTKQLRPGLRRLEATGLITPIRRHGVDLWGLTTKGQIRLASVRDQVALPEAPQHRRWREATTLAAECVTDLRSRLGETLLEASNLLNAPDTSAEVWFDLSERLCAAGWDLGAATHCLREWPEPSDEQADVDDAPPRLRGRRRARRWLALD